MFVYTLSKKRAVSATLIVLAVLVAVAIGAAAVFTSISTGAVETKLPIYSVDTKENKVAITFDCAWGNSNTDELLAILAKEGVKATFFVTGEFASKYPEDVRKMADAGHEIGNHSNTHIHLKKTNINTLIEDTNEAARKIEIASGVKPTLYRAPFGEYDNNSVSTLEGMGYKIIQWSVDSIDWDDPKPAVIEKRVLEGAQPGSIILFHNDRPNTTEALPNLLVKLKQKGFGFTPAGKLIYNDNYYLDNTGKQIYDTSKSNYNYATYSDNAYVNAAMAKIQQNFTYDELTAMGGGISSDFAARLTEILTPEQVAAFTSMSDEEYAFAWKAMMSSVSAGANVPSIAVDTDNIDGVPLDDEYDEAVPGNEDETPPELAENGTVKENNKNPTNEGNTGFTIK